MFMSCRSVRRLAGAFALSALTAAPALATEALECRFEQKAVNGSWVPEVVVVAWETGSDQVMVYDPLIEQFVGEPMPARIDTDNARRTTWSWEVKVKSGTNQNARMKFRLTMMKADRSAQISVTPQGYADNFQSSGSCKPVKP